MPSKMTHSHWHGHLSTRSPQLNKWQRGTVESGLHISGLWLLCARQRRDNTASMVLLHYKSQIATPSMNLFNILFNIFSRLQFKQSHTADRAHAFSNQSLWVTFHKVFKTLIWGFQSCWDTEKKNQFYFVLNRINWVVVATTAILLWHQCWQSSEALFITPTPSWELCQPCKHRIKLSN